MAENNSKKTKVRKIKVQTAPNWFSIGMMAFLIMCSTYLIFQFIEQQMDINTLKKEQNLLASQIQEEKQAIEQIKQNLKDIESPAFIEKQAREILGMVKPDEKVYIDLNKQE